MTSRLTRYLPGFFLAAICVLTPVPCVAQDPNPKATQAGVTPAGEPLVTVAGLQGGYSGSAFQALLDASADEKTATAVIGWKDGSGGYALTFKSPLNAKAKEAVPISLEGLANGAGLQFAANNLFWRGPDLDEQAESDEICDRLFGASAPCSYIKMPPGKDRARYAEIQHLKDIPWYLGVSGGVSVTTYKYREGTELKEASKKVTDYSLSAQGGLFRPSLGFVIGTLAYQQSSSGGESVSLCQPLAETNATTCTESVLKPPTETRGMLASFQMRRKLKGDVAIAPTIQYDVQKDVTAVIVPVYFLKDAKGTPIGGVRAGWRSDTDAVVISLFVGAAFKLTP